MDIQELRQKYPHYDDITNEELATKFHTKFYPDMPFGEFAKKIGYKQDPNVDIDTTTGLTNIPLRIKMGFLEAPEDKEKLLKRLHPDAHRLADGRLAYKNPETGKETAVDEEAFSVRDLADWVGMIPEIGMGTLGVVATAPVPIPGARMGGAALGTVAGRGAKEKIGAHFLGEPTKAQRERTIHRDFGEAFVAGGVGEGVGGVVVKGLAPFAKKIEPGAKRAIEYFKQYKGRFTPAQITEVGGLDLLENVAESSILGGAPMRAFKKEQKTIAGNIADDIATRIGSKATPEQAGVIVQKILEQKRTAFNAAGKALYKKVDITTKGVLVSTGLLKKESARLLKQITPEQALVPSLKNKTTARMLKDFSQLPDKVPFSYLQQWRSDLLQIGYGPSDLIPGKTAGVAKHLANRIDKVFKQAEGGLSGDALTALKNANTVWGAGKKFFNDTFIKRMAKTDPEKISNMVFKPNAIQPIKKLKQVLGSDTKMWKKVKGSWLTDTLLEKSKASGKAFNTAMNKMGRPTLKEIFTDQELKELTDFGLTLARIEEKATGIGGGMLIQLSQAGALIEVTGAALGVGRGVSALSMGLLLGPSALTHIFKNPVGIKWLTTGLMTRRTSKEATRLTSRILAQIPKEDMGDIIFTQREQPIRREPPYPYQGAIK